MYQMWRMQCIKYGECNVSNVVNAMYQIWRMQCIKCGEYNVSNALKSSV